MVGIGPAVESIYQSRHPLADLNSIKLHTPLAIDGLQCLADWCWCEDGLPISPKPTDPADWLFVFVVHLCEVDSPGLQGLTSAMPIMLWHAMLLSKEVISRSAKELGPVVVEVSNVAAMYVVVVRCWFGPWLFGFTDPAGMQV